MKKRIGYYVALFVMCFVMFFCCAHFSDVRAATTTNTVYYNFVKCSPTSLTVGKNYVFIANSLGISLSGSSCLLAVPDSAAILQTTSTSNNCTNYASGSGYTLAKYVSVVQKGTGFDNCTTGGLFYSGSNIYYYCSGSGIKALAGTVYSYETAEYTSQDLSVTASGTYPITETTLTKNDLTVTLDIGNKTYTVADYTITDGTVNYIRGDTTITVKFGNLSASTEVEFEVALPSGNIVKTVEREEAHKEDTNLHIGETLSYSVTISSSTANSIWKDVVFSDTLPTGLTLDTSSIRLKDPNGTVHSIPASAYNSSTHTLSFSLCDYSTVDYATENQWLLSGDKYVVTFDASINAYAVDADEADVIKKVTNTATASGTNNLGTAKRTVSGQATVMSGENPIPSYVQPSDPDDLNVLKTALNKTEGHNNNATQVYDCIQYTIAVVNNKVGSEWVDVTISDTIPEGLEVDTGSFMLLTPTNPNGIALTGIYDETTRKISCKIGNVYGGENYKLVFDVTVLPEVLKNVTKGEGTPLDIGNTAYATGDTPDDPDEGTEGETITRSSTCVYPCETDKDFIGYGNPTEDDIKVTKTVENLTDTTDGAPTQVYDTLFCEIKFQNTLAETVLNDTYFCDYIQPGMDLDLDSMYVTRPDGEKIKLDSSHYNENTREIYYYIGDIYCGELYVLQFELVVNADAMEPLDDGEPADIGNIGTITGKTPDEEDISVESNGGTSVYPNPEEDTDGVLPGDPGEEDITVDKTATNLTDTEDGAATQIFDSIRYCVSVTNELIGTLWQNVEIYDCIPEGLQLDTDSIVFTGVDGSRTALNSDVYNPETREIRYLFGNLYGGQSVSLEYDVVITEAVAAPEKEGEAQLDIGNIGHAAGSTLSGEEIDVESSTSYPRPDDEDGIYYADPEEAYTSMKKTATNLSDSVNQTQVGDIIEYKIYAENLKDGTEWGDVVIHDTMPAGLAIDPASIQLIYPSGETRQLSRDVYNSDTREVSVYVGGIRGGERYTLRFLAEVTEDALGKSIGNSAYVAGGKPAGTDPVSTDPDDPDSDDPSIPDPGDSGTYTPGDPYFPEDGTDTPARGVMIILETPEPVSPRDPDDPVIPDDPEPVVDKTVTNQTHSDGYAHDDDALKYEIKITNARSGSVWNNIVMYDRFPANLILDESSIRLTYPNGRIERIKASEVVKGNVISLTIPVIKGGETYTLTYKMTVSIKEDGDGSSPSEEITNEVSVTGDSPEGTSVAGSGIAVIKIASNGVGVKTGDSSHPEIWVLLLLLSGSIGAVALRGSKKNRRTRKGANE